MSEKNRFLMTGLGILLWFSMWEFACGYIGTLATMGSRGTDRNGNLVEIADVAVALANLLSELDQPHDMMTMSDHPFMNLDDVGCPLNLCHHAHGIVMVPHRPRLFVTCLPNRHFCGLCPRGTILRADYRSFRCVPTTKGVKNDDSEGCQLDNSCQTSLWPRLLISVVNDTKIRNFTVCSKKRSFCGFCQSDISFFNQSTLTCNERFPETTFLCPLSDQESVHPDPLTPCSPIAYFCSRTRRRGDAIRCPIPKLRYSKTLSGCDLPENVPECGGMVRSDANDTFVELLPYHSANQPSPRLDPIGNCVAHCIYVWGNQKNVCMRICST